MIKSIVFDAYGTLYDVFSVTEKCEEVFQGKGLEISQIWRQKQLEYSWLHALMGKYTDFWKITKDALCYALESLELQYSERETEIILNAYYHLKLYPDVMNALKCLSHCKKVILTNGNSEMLSQLSINTGLNKLIDRVLSADSVKTFKPENKVYQLAVDYLGAAKSEILFVSSNGWDAAGAKAFGFSVGWINRFDKPIEKLGFQPDYIVSNLLELSTQIIKGI